MHAACVEVLSRADLQLVIPAFVVAEATYMIERQLGPEAEAAFLYELMAWEVEPPLADEYRRISELVTQYADLPLGGTDAALIALAERLEASTIITLDRRHFSVVRPRHVGALQLLPTARAA